jgi:hypothetical protein
MKILRGHFCDEYVPQPGQLDWLRAVDLYATLILPRGAKWNPTELSEDWKNPRECGALSGASFLFALLQSLCTAVLTISGIRVAIGLTALAAA